MTPDHIVMRSGWYACGTKPGGVVKCREMLEHLVPGWLMTPDHIVMRSGWYVCGTKPGGVVVRCWST